MEIEHKKKLGLKNVILSNLKNYLKLIAKNAIYRVSQIYALNFYFCNEKLKKILYKRGALESFQKEV